MDEGIGIDDTLRRRTTPPHTRRPQPLVRARSAVLEELLKRDGEAFWQEVAERGTPLVEASEIEGHDIVTFLDRARADEPSTVLVASKLTDMFAPAETRLEQIEGTDVRSLSLLLPADWVAGYALARSPEPIPAVIAPGTGEYGAWRALSRNARPDPLCKDGIAQKPSWPRISVGAASAAPPRPAFGAGGGRTVISEIDSAVLGGSRTASIYLPRDVVAPERLLVLLDGEVWEQRLPAVLDEMTLHGQLPPVAAVFLDSRGPERRQVDYTPGAAFEGFLTGDLPAALRAAFPSLAEGGHVIAGQSLGGLCAVATSVAAPEVYGAAVSQSGSFWWPSATPFEEGRNVIAQQLSAARGPLPRVILECGRMEWEMREDSRRLHDVLRARDADAVLLERGGGHDIAWWERTLPGSLREAFRGDPLRADAQ